MPAVRTSKSRPTASTSASTSSPSERPGKPEHSKSKHSATRRRKQHQEGGVEDASLPMAVPGVQKIKAALRQTRRLLAKDKLGADVRVETERRLRALEGDLARAEQARKERTIAVRYHKVKFFERQKVTRKLDQTKRKLSNPDVLPDKERKRLEKELLNLRLDLNYILHYPKTKKYISLFPPEVRQQHQPTSNTDVDSNDAQDNLTDAQRAEIRKWVRQQMAEGAISGEPEVELARGEKRKMMGTRTENKAVVGATTGTENGKESGKGGFVGDEFFEEEDEESPESAENEDEDDSGDEDEED